MIGSSFGQVSNLEPAIGADFILDFSSGNLPATVSGPTAGAGPRTYCDQDRMYVALAGQPRIGYDHDALRWGLRRDIASENMVAYSQPDPTLPAPSGWNGNANGLATTVFNAADFLLPSERCAMMNYSASGSTYVYPSGSSAAMQYTAGVRYTASVFIKQIGAVAIDVPLVLHSAAFGVNQSVLYQASTGRAIAGSGNVAGTIVGMETYPDGWRRIYVTAVCTTTAASYPPILWPGGNRDGRFLFGGFQLEALGYPTAYIPTRRGRATRGNEVGITAEFPPDFFVGSPNGASATMWSEFRVATLFQTAAAGIFGIERAPVASSPYVCHAVVNSSGLAQQTYRTYYQGTTAAGTPAANTTVDITGLPPKNVHVSTWENATPNMRLAQQLSNTIAAHPSFPGMVPGMSSTRAVLGTLGTQTANLMTGWIYGARLYRRFVSDDELRILTGI